MRPFRFGSSVVLLLLSVSASLAQAPRINALFPNGGRAGSEVEVEIRGAGLAGAKSLLVNGPGVSGTVGAGSGKIDERGKPIWQAKCNACHELRSPANRSMSPAQWTATVERMVKVNNAPLSADEQEKVTAYLTSSARAGKVLAHIQVAANTPPSIVELRVATNKGVSSAALFETGDLPEVQTAHSTPQQPQPVTLPCVVNGSIEGQGERYYLKFHSAAGQRLVFDLAAYRFNEQTQLFFNPALRLLDAKGAELAENHGYHELDPLIDWTCPTAGDYVLEVSDILGRGNPASVYRLRMGAVPFDTAAFPPAGPAGQAVAMQVVGPGVESGRASFRVALPRQQGVAFVGSPGGAQRVLVSPFHVVTAPDFGPAPQAAAPVCLSGRIAKAGQTVEFPLRGEGQFEVEAYTERVGSTADVQLALIDGKGAAIARGNGEGRFQIGLAKDAAYTMRVTDGRGQGGPTAVFAVEVRPVRPVLGLVARPSEIALRRGSATSIQVILTRREGVDGDVTVSADGLPPGVTVEPMAIQPDRYDGWLVIRAAGNAPESAASFQVVATAKGPSGEGRAVAVPQEYARMGNEDRYLDRRTCAAAVGGEPDFDAHLVDAAPVKVHPRTGVEAKVTIKRRAGFQGAVYARLIGLPYGWVTNVETIPPGRDEVTLLVRPDGNNPIPFIQRGPKLTPVRCLLEAWSDDFHFVFDARPTEAKPLSDDDKKALKLK